MKDGMMYVEYPFAVLRGLTLKDVRGAEKGSGLVTFVCDSGTVFTMYHEQDCCEDVRLEDVAGDPQHLIGRPITLALESSKTGTDVDHGHATWTFYRIGTVMGTVVLRWLGTSNGYYSEDVTFAREFPRDATSERLYYFDALRHFKRAVREEEG